MGNSTIQGEGREGNKLTNPASHLKKTRSKVVKFRHYHSKMSKAFVDSGGIVFTASIYFLYYFIFLAGRMKFR